MEIVTVAAVVVLFSLKLLLSPLGKRLYSTRSSLGLSATYPYNIDCNNDGTYELIDVVGNDSCNYASAGRHTIAMSGDIPRLYFDKVSDAAKIRTVEQWGTSPWQSMKAMFDGANQLTLSATDAPDLSGVSDITDIFNGATALKGNNISKWDVSNITHMTSVFSSASNCNGDISG